MLRLLDYTNTFNRKEVKYRLDGEKHDCLMSVFDRYLRPSEFGTAQVSSLYLDTEDRHLIARSLEKPLYKEKIRIRAYGADSIEDASIAYLEIKKKFKGIVYKRRVALSASDAMRFVHGESCVDLIERSRCGLERGIESCGSKDMLFLEDEKSKHGVPLKDIKPNDLQIAREIDAFTKRYSDLKPSALIRCTRSAYELIDDDDNLLRITFDTDLEALDLFNDARPVEVLGKDESIMEIKCLGAYPLWLVEVLDACGVYPQSFSKYGEMYEKRGL